MNVKIQINKVSYVTGYMSRQDGFLRYWLTNRGVLGERQNKMNLPQLLGAVTIARAVRDHARFPALVIF